MTARYCSLAQAPAPAFAPGLAAERLSALASGRRMWVNGTVLHYWFFDGDSDASVIPVPGRGMTRRVPWAGAEEQRDVVRAGFREWQDLGIGITFAEVGDRSEAELRIGFQAGDGSWSRVGREALPAGGRDRTMNFGWDLTAQGEHGTALHRIGHALGLLRPPSATATPSWCSSRSGTGSPATSPAGTTGELRTTPRSAPGSSRAAVTSSAYACTPPGVPAGRR
ncbi:hypothetical protein A4E84_35235 [Streptomyces qaidamensis]|uniref:Peptidase metallopeptidase domain-containing protein n=1 Tax=Streptomyces qaidamensis TaxID=1783515 RepID=A0A143CA73_9ACTN|nr:hypothetical protein A4E84_35235 [Streptomyces qaidamensis]